MPVYEYRCEDCGSKFEKLVRRSDDSNALVCRPCGENHLQHELSTHANGSSKSSQAPSFPSGGCANPGMCGMNFN
jgi:putative FmdB family regulatory protein